MNTLRPTPELDGLAAVDASETQLLTPAEERELLRELGACKAQLAAALAKLPGAEPPGGLESDPQALADFIAEVYARQPRAEARLGAVYARYKALRSKLAMANLRLVAHVAKRFRDRGVAYSDLMQEGFCGLLEAIDRFDLIHQTKLATYATWWIRQAMQRALAAGAYPVRLSPRHLRQLAQNQGDLERVGAGSGPGEGEPSEMIRRIHAATRPTISLDATIDRDGTFTLLQTISDPEVDPGDDLDTDETVTRLMDSLRPREQQVLELRFGLRGKPRMSLSQVGKVLEVSKERVRQIQDRALEKLRVQADGMEGAGALAGAF